MRGDCLESQRLSIMATELRKTHQQLAFPELALSAEPPVADEIRAHSDDDAPPAVEAALDVDPQKSLGDAPAQNTRKAPRKRAARPQMVLVKDVAEDLASDSPSPLQAVEATSTQPAGEALLAPESVEQPEIPTKDTRHAVPYEAPVSPAAHVLTNPGAEGKNRLKIWASMATISAALAMIAALVIGSTQFIETQQQQRELLAAQAAVLQQEGSVKAAEMNAKAAELFLRYNDLMLQVNAPALKNGRKENRYWKEALAINLLESLFNLTRGKKEWETSIGWALERHGRFIREQRLNCAGYSNEFVRYLEKNFATKATAFCKDLANPESAAF